MAVLAPDRPFVRAVGDEPLPGYRLIAPLGLGGFGEVWKCLAPGGLHKAIKFVFQDAEREGESDSLRQEYEAFERIKGIRHPFLLSLERVELNGDELMMVMELADQNLAQCFEGYRKSGRSGIPREELLSYMADAAEVLDVLSQQHRLQHLDIKPANMFLMGGHSKVGDYGLVSRFRIGGGEEPDFDRGLTPRYVSPEILRGHIDGRSDQYSLALVYQELLTGQFPYSGKTSQQLMTQHSSGEPDVSPLPHGDREAVRRALAKEPSHRFQTCLAFVRELMRAGQSGAMAFPAPRALHDTPAPVVYRDAASIAATQRLNPNVTQRVDGSSVPELPKSIDVFCPEMQFIQDGDGPGKRGKRILASDPSGRQQRVLMLRLESGLPAEIDRLFKQLSQPMAGVSQSLRRASTKNFTLFCPDDHRPLSELGTVAERDTALAIMAHIADTLDRLHAECGLPHGLLSTGNIVADGEGFALTEYGVGSLLLLARANPEWLDHEPTAAPEVAKGMPLPSSDQFSLAIVYLQLIGAWPSDQKRVGRGERGALNPNIRWNMLSVPEAVAVKRALASYPPDRFGSCAEFVKALASDSSKTVILDEVFPLLSVARLHGENTASVPEAQEWMDRLLLSVGAAALLPKQGVESSLAITQRPDCSLVARFPIQYSEGMLALKLEAFRREMRYVMEKTPQGVYLAPRLDPQGSYAGVELDVQVPRGSVARLAEIEVVGRACNRRDADRLAGMIAGVLEKFRRALTDKPDLRRAPRYRGEWAVNLYSIDDDLVVAEPMGGVCLDISEGGFRCALPNALPGEHAYLNFSGIEDVQSTAVLVRILRSTPQPNGTVHISGRFLLG